MPPETLAEFRLRYARSIARLYARSDASRWGLSEADLAQAAWDGLRSSIPGASETEVQSYLDSLQARDLALACACRAGLERAWECFIAEFRPILYAAAGALTREPIAARELADSLYAELYGIEVREGKRRSLLAYFHGRSSLATWLRAVLSQRFVDAYRTARRTEPIDDRTAAAAEAPAAAPDPPDPNRARYLDSLREALEAALQALKPRDRLRLSCYYLEQMTLKDLGRLTGEHESTVSRRLARTRKALRRQVERNLRREKRFSDEQIRLCYDYAVEEWPFDLRKALSQPDSQQEMNAASFKDRMRGKSVG
jgi:RNA polymerase sigma-70 factor (ECF subfamily)